MSLNKPQISPSVEDQANAATDRAAEAADSAVNTSRRVANDALDHVESAIHSARASVQPTIARLASQAESLARRGLDAVKDSAAQARERAHTAGDVTVRYVRDEPVKAVLIAAATGAALVALISLLNRRDR